MKRKQSTLRREYEHLDIQNCLWICGKLRRVKHEHASEDYNRIQDPDGKMAMMSLVFLWRAKDKYAPIVVRMWAELVEASGDIDLADLAFEHACDHGRMARGQRM